MTSQVGTLVRSSPKNWLKYLLLNLGARASAPRVRQVLGMAGYVALGRWMADQGFRFEDRSLRREEIFDRVASQVASQRVLYLEFGVYTGASMRYWSRRLTHPEARLHGFDSFEGLPESIGVWRKGQFDAGGTIPEIDDPRVEFFKGWFDQVLPSYAPPPHDVLVVTMDADLYSSTIYVLRHLRPWIRPGTYIYFDEMEQVDHEPRAFGEFIQETGLRFRGVSAHISCMHAAFQCVA